MSNTPNTHAVPPTAPELQAALATLAKLLPQAVAQIAEPAPPESPTAPEPVTVVGATATAPAAAATPQPREERTTQRPAGDALPAGLAFDARETAEFDAGPLRRSPRPSVTATGFQLLRQWPLIVVAAMLLAVVYHFAPAKGIVVCYGVAKLALFGLGGALVDYLLHPGDQPEALQGVAQGTAWKRRGMIVAASIIAGALLS